MKKKSKFFALAVALIICCALCLTACGDPEDATIGDGGIVPEGNYMLVEFEGSSFYVPSDSRQNEQENFHSYTFSDGSFTVLVSDTRAKVQRVSRNSYERSLKKEIKDTGYSYTLDDYKFYKLSGLWIRAVEVTLYNSEKAVKKYQYAYSTGSKQIIITVEYNSIDTAEDSDFPAKLLYSISVK